MVIRWMGTGYTYVYFSGWPFLRQVPAWHPWRGLLCGNLCLCGTKGKSLFGAQWPSEPL